MPDKTSALLTAAQTRKLQRALDILNSLAESLGDRWDDYDFDQLNLSRSAIREWDGWPRENEQ